MEKDKALKHTDHYRCRLCGQISPITETLCIKPGCRAQLSIYGDLISAADNKESTSNAGTKVTGGSDTGTTGGTTIQPEKKDKKRKDTVKADTTDAKPEKNGTPHNRAKRWKASTIIAGLVVAAMAVALYISYDEVAQWRDDYYDLRYDYRGLRDDYDNLKDDYDNLKDDYDDLKYAYDDYQEFWDNNNLSELYSVEVTQVFNADSDGNKINQELNASTLDRLAIGIDITAGGEKNRWAEPLEIKLTQSGKEIAKWTISPGDKYDDGTKTVGWKMWTGGVTTAGTYVAEFYHKGLVVARYEITVR